jgi:acetoin utilization deacetylase AcuC-like enzyme
VAYLAAGAVITAVDEIFSGRARNAFCLVRPPGHHATSSYGMGFCLLDNLAIGARYAQVAKGVSRIMIVDWDAHHGNGLQDTFLADNNVLYLSLHQYPHYPGSGHQTEIGQGAGRGFTVNIPFPAGVGGESFRLAFEEIVLPIGEIFAPELVLIAAGYDGHYADPLSGLRLYVSDFAMMSGYLCRLADGLAKGRLIASLEGGYNLRSLSLSVAQTIIQFAGLDTILEEPFREPRSGSPVFIDFRGLIEQVKEILRPFWRL